MAVATGCGARALIRAGDDGHRDEDFDGDWNEHLHDLLGAPWPCPEVQKLRNLLDDISVRLVEKGLGTGLHTYGWYSDAEIDLCTATWCAVRHTHPPKS